MCSSEFIIHRLFAKNYIKLVFFIEEFKNIIYNYMKTIYFKDNINKKEGSVSSHKVILQ